MLLKGFFVSAEENKKADGYAKPVRWSNYHTKKWLGGKRWSENSGD